MIGNALKLLRVFHNLKQKELAEKLGFSASYLSEIESGKKEATMETLQLYADCFKIPTSSLIYFAEHIDKRGRRRNVSPIAVKALKMLEWFDTITRDEDDDPKEISA